MNNNKLYEEHERIYANINELLHDIPDDWNAPYFLETVMTYLVKLVYHCAPCPDCAKELIKKSVVVGRTAYEIEEEPVDNAEEYEL